MSCISYHTSYQIRKTRGLRHPMSSHRVAQEVVKLTPYLTWYLFCSLFYLSLRFYAQVCETFLWYMICFMCLQVMMIRHHHHLMMKLLLADSNMKIYPATWEWWHWGMKNRSCITSQNRSCNTSCNTSYITKTDHVSHHENAQYIDTSYITETDHLSHLKTHHI